MPLLQRIWDCLSSYSRRSILFTSIALILVSAAPVVSPEYGFRPVKQVSDYLTPELQASVNMKTLSGKIKSGQTVSSLLNPYLPLSVIYDLDRQSRDIYPLTRLRMNQPYYIHLMEGELALFEYDIDDQDCLVIEKEADAFTISKKPIEYEIKDTVVAVNITSTLSEAVTRVGEGVTLTWKLADIFAWDIDFAKDIRPGDKFKVLVEKRYRHDKFYGYADVKAAFFVNQGKKYKAFLHQGEGGHKRYYDENGNSLEKTFLKAPLNYSRITSGFSKRRFHPILKEYRPHPGVDYAAPLNTPIKAVADGKIISINYSKTTGRQITLGHLGGYETSYFHMNKYASGMKRGKEVNQGDVIGYVGKTGLATGYHTCFRMRKNGRPVNPMTQAPRSAGPVDAGRMDDFLRLAGEYTRIIQSYLKIAGTAGDHPGS